MIHRGEILLVEWVKRWLTNTGSLADDSWKVWGELSCQRSERVVFSLHDYWLQWQPLYWGLGLEGGGETGAASTARGLPGIKEHGMWLYHLLKGCVIGSSMRKDTKLNSVYNTWCSCDWDKRCVLSVSLGHVMSGLTRDESKCLFLRYGTRTVTGMILLFH